MKRKEKHESIGAVRERERESNRLKKLKEKTWNKTRQKTWNKGAKNRSVCSCQIRFFVLFLYAKI